MFQIKYKWEENKNDSYLTKIFNEKGHRRDQSLEDGRIAQRVHVAVCKSEREKNGEKKQLWGNQ